MPQTLKFPLTLTGGTGVTLSNEGTNFDASQPLVQDISVGNDISTTGKPQFNVVTASSYDLSGYTLLSDRWTTNFTAGGDFKATGNLTIAGNITIGGNVTSEEFISELTSSSTIFKSGSTKFGDDRNDTHYFTGSLYNSGSFNLLGTNITEISNDISLGDESSTALATESSSLAYITNQLGGSGVSNTDLYLRKNCNKTMSSVSNNTASFIAALTASSPAGMTSTSEDDFLFFNNGQVMEHDALQIQQSRGTFYLISDPNSLGYNLSSDDEIKAWGRFESKGELKFDGSNDEVTTSFSGSSSQGTDTPSPKTYSFWAKSSTTARNYAIFGYGSNKKSFLFNFDAGRPLRWYGNWWYVFWDDTSAQDDGQWHHWMVYDSPSDLSLSKLYVDGTLISINQIVDTSEDGAASYGQNLTIGSYKNNNTAVDAHFSGSIKEFSVFGGDKTSYASTYYNNGTPYDVTNETDLQAYWKMTEGGGTTVFDYSNNTDSNGNRYDGTIDGATWEAIE